MIGREIPRYLLFAITTGVAVMVIILSMFYGQYRWLAGEIIATSSVEHDIVLKASYERRMRSKMHAIADRFAAGIDISDAATVFATMDRALSENTNMTGLRFTASSQREFSTGSFPIADINTPVTWLPDRLVMTYPVVAAGRRVGELAASFQLTQLRAESAAFAQQLVAMKLESRRISFLWIGFGTLFTLALCGALVWMIVRNQTARIQALKLQARKLRDSDFGELLPENRGDEIGQLAAVFNDMRAKLRSTTISRDYLNSILSSMNDAIIVTTQNGTIKRVNNATTRLLGYEKEDLLNMSIDFIVNTEKSGSLINDAPSGLPKEVFFKDRNGQSIPVSYTCSILRGREAESGDRIFAAQNITERRRAEKRIRYLARIDALTKIPNRMQFQHLLQRAIARARRNATSLCLLYIDIDRFKDINDTFGHGAGDTTLETVAGRLRSALPKKTVIGRLAGDEFAVIVECPDQDSAATSSTDKLAQQLLDSLAEPFFEQGHEVFMTASIGIAFFPLDARNVIDLIRNADAALYHCKKSGGNVYSYYSPDMNEATVERLMTKSKLKRAFERDELLVHYQPKYDLETGEVFGAEALVRWELPERGMILPSDFIPIAEETHLIIEIGEWVLDKVCEDFRCWQRSVSSPGRVSVNLSLKQLRQANFTDRIRSILRSYEVSPTSLELEITETTLMEDPERTIKLLNQLYALGLHLAIDDFGTGYSSLSALQQFPINTLKIDKSFVRDVASNPDDATIISTIIQMGRNLNLDVVAEGVETEDQLNCLQQLGCTYVQGLLFGHPMSSDDYLELLLAQAEGTDTYQALFG